MKLSLLNLINFCCPGAMDDGGLLGLSKIEYVCGVKYFPFVEVLHKHSGLVYPSLNVDSWVYFEDTWLWNSWWGLFRSSHWINFLMEEAHALKEWILKVHATISCYEAYHCDAEKNSLIPRWPMHCMLLEVSGLKTRTTFSFCLRIASCYLVRIDCLFGRIDCLFIGSDWLHVCWVIYYA